MSLLRAAMGEDRHFGAVPGIVLGDIFVGFPAMKSAGLHNQMQAGISGSGKRGAESVVVSGGYEDDQDFGNEIIYTGEGGQGADGKQVKDQTLTRGNLALVTSEIEGLPVRVIRRIEPKKSSDRRYRYDGLFRVDRHWHETGKSGFKIWRYRLIKNDDSVAKADVISEEQPGLFEAHDVVLPGRVTTTVQRIVRDTLTAKKLKFSYRHMCQVCRRVLETGGGPYVEVAHIRALGRPHNGPDIQENMLCLCPNHHVMFDLGGFSIANDYSLIGLNNDPSLSGTDRKLYVQAAHAIDLRFLQYHREHFLNLAE